LQGFKGCCICEPKNKGEYNNVGQAGGQERAEYMVCHVTDSMLGTDVLEQKKSKHKVQEHVSKKLFQVTLRIFKFKKSFSKFLFS
jgi:hypothetical protein